MPASWPRIIDGRTRVRRRDPGHLPAVRLPRGRPRRASPRSTATSAVGAQNVHHELAGAYTGEISAPMLEGLATWVIVGHSERRRDAGETDALIGRKLARAVEAGLRPILCVGEQLEEREAGRAVEVVATQLRGPSPSTIRRALTTAGLVIAYEPVWAIGTGRNATGGDAAAMADAIRAALADARLARRRGRRAGPVRRQRDLGQHRRVPGRAAIDGALVGGASLKPDEMAGIVARAGMTAARPRPGRVTAGAPPTDRPGRPRRVRDRSRPGRRCHRRRADADLARAPGALAAQPARGVGGCGRAARRPDGQLRGRPPQPRGGATGPPGPAAHRRGHRRWVVRRAAGPPRRVPPGRASGDGRCTSSASSGRAASTPTTDTWSPWPSWRRGAGSPSVAVHALLDGRDTPPSRPWAMSGTSRRGWRRPIRGRHRDRRRALLRDGPRPALGARRARLRRDRPRRGRAPCPVGASRPSRTRTRAARPTSSWPRRSSAARGRMLDGDPVIHANFRADRARQLTHALVDGPAFDGFDRTSPSGRPAPTTCSS